MLFKKFSSSHYVLNVGSLKEKTHLLMTLTLQSFKDGKEI